jgi:hypothetical protein
MRLKIFAVFVASFALFVAGSAQAQTAATVTVQPEGVIVGGGDEALVFVIVECTLDPGDELLEGHVTLGQEFASGFGSLNPTCDGKPHRNLVRVRTFDATFQNGEAFASAFLLFLDPVTGETVQAQDSRTITLRGRPGP